MKKYIKKCNKYCVDKAAEKKCSHYFETHCISTKTSN